MSSYLNLYDSTNFILRIFNFDELDEIDELPNNKLALRFYNHIEQLNLKLNLKSHLLNHIFGACNAVELCKVAYELSGLVCPINIEQSIEGIYNLSLNLTGPSQKIYQIIFNSLKNKNILALSLSTISTIEKEYANRRSGYTRSSRYKALYRLQSGINECMEAIKIDSDFPLDSKLIELFSKEINTMEIGSGAELDNSFFYKELVKYRENATLIKTQATESEQLINGYATSWGNITKEQLMFGSRPGHVISASNIFITLTDKISEKIFAGSLIR